MTCRVICQHLVCLIALDRQLGEVRKGYHLLNLLIGPLVRPGRKTICKRQKLQACLSIRAQQATRQNALQSTISNQARSVTSISSKGHVRGARQQPQRFAKIVLHSSNGFHQRMIRITKRAAE